MSDTLIRLAGPVAGTGSDATLYTVPGATAIDVRNIHIVNNDASTARTCKMSIGADATGTRIIPAGFTLAPIEIVDLDLHLVLNAADVVHWTGETTLTVTLSGVAVT